MAARQGNSPISLIYQLYFTAIFLAAAKNSVADTILMGIMIAIAQRSDSAPSEALSKSLMTPTTNGPKPRPIRFIARKKTAEVSDRMEAGTRLCDTASAGPRYMLCSEAHKPRHATAKYLSCKNKAPAAQGIPTIMA